MGNDNSFPNDSLGWFRQENLNI